MNRRPTLPGRHRRPVAVTVLAALTAALVAAPTSAAGPSPSVSAWVVARQAGAIGTPSTPGPKDQGNSTGGTNTVTRTAIGEYEVVMPGVGGTGGTVQVTPLNSQPRWCFPTGYGSGQDLKLKIFIRCTALNGALASSKFVVTYTVGTGSHGTSPARLGYALTDDTGTPGIPSESFQHTSAGTTIALAQTATGRYTLTLPGMGVTGGTVQVTSHQGAATCHPLSWAPSGGDKIIRVACTTPAGADMDTVMHVLFLSRLGPEGFGGGPSAYLWANKPKAASYVPIATHRYNSKGRSMTVLRGGRGSYTVVLTGMPAGGAVIVTAQGAGKAHCQLSSLGSVVPMKAIVRCYAPNGAAADSAFTLAYTK